MVTSTGLTVSPCSSQRASLPGGRSSLASLRSGYEQSVHMLEDM